MKLRWIILLDLLLIAAAAVLWNVPAGQSRHGVKDHVTATVRRAR